MKKSFLADIGLLYSAAVWGSTFFVVKDSLSQVDPIMLVAYRFLLATLLMLPFIIKKDIKKNFKEGFVLGFILWILYISQTIGLKFTKASNSGFITGLFIVFVPIFSLMLFKHKPNKRRVLAVFLALAGLWMLTGGLKEINIGDALTLIAALTYALHILFVDRYVKEADPFVLNFQQIFVVGALSFATGLIFRLPMQIGSTLPVILFLTIFPTLSAFLIQLVAQQYTTPLKVALLLTMEPVFAAIFAWTMGGETFILSNALGGLLIVIAMIISELPLKNENR